ncbi:protein HtrL [Ditylenchus destructor]|uniref:Protein HtrL n=1 Tax=Ditylenchus destructor TaxID=166010 RepID=A0AAD4MY79_9BILA|nr:protein HtrL [Ditylenchus destructor]
MRSSLARVNVWLVAVIAAIVLGNAYLLYVLWGKLLRNIDSQNSNSLSSSTLPSTSTTGQMTIRVQAKDISTIRAFTSPYPQVPTRLSSTISITAASELPTTATTEISILRTHHKKLTNSSQAPYPIRRLDRPGDHLPDPAQVDNKNDYRSGSQSREFPTIRVTFDDRQTTVRPNAHHTVAHHDRHTSLEADDSGPQAVNLPTIRVTSADLSRLYPAKTQHVEEKVPDERVDEQSPHGQIFSTTLVTALIDIDRERWPFYGRPFAKYHAFLHNVLQLRMPMVIFVSPRSFEFVRSERQNIGWLEWTKIWVVTIEDLPLYLYQRSMSSIVDREQNGGGWRPEWDDAIKTHPEAYNVKYDIVVNSKAYFLHNASLDNPFETQYFAWLDAGYGHGKSQYFPPNFVWKPVFEPGKVSLIKLTPYSDDIKRYGIKDLYRQDVAVISGGFLAGDRETLSKFYQHYHWKVVRLIMHQQVVDDDQTVLVLLINDLPDMFNIALGYWFDAFQLF